MISTARPYFDQIPRFSFWNSNKMNKYQSFLLQQEELYITSIDFSSIHQPFWISPPNNTKLQQLCVLVCVFG
ncbi:unnamed protein product [Coffea canephora]|uniref:Uncharacterized protein n=1 Tax=Coffea canephora TaxID=49390 RepID=A0A068TKI3_COFCA|nr:unnamed protein product [Coffea canephora]